jgi:hypothetical protein
MSRRWSSNSEAAKLLEKGLKDVSIDANAAPKTIYEQNPSFQAFRLANFRSNLNKMKAKLGIHLRKSNDGILSRFVDVPC